jgi:hypothetical protein
MQRQRLLFELIGMTVCRMLIIFITIVFTASTNASKNGFSRSLKKSFLGQIETDIRTVFALLRVTLDI